MSDYLNQSEEDKLVQLACTTNVAYPLKKDQNYEQEQAKIEAIEEHFRAIMDILGLDLEDPSLAETPYRVAKMYVKEVFAGLHEKNFPEMTFMEDYSASFAKGEMVLVRDVTVNSFCEHHFVPMTGHAHVAYIPNGKLLGLSKINRIVWYFSHRPQIQERLGAQIADSLSILLATNDVAVVMDLRHSCVNLRGIEDSCSSTYTQVLRGQFQEDSQKRQEFLSQAVRK